MEGTTSQQKLFQALTLLALIAGVFGIVLIINQIRYPSPNAYEHTIVVNGEGEVTAVPDIATFSYGVTAQADTPAEAQEQATEIANAALAYLKGQGIEEKDIKTEYYNVYPRYEWVQETIYCITYPCPQPPGEQVLKGYEVNQGVSVKVRDTEKAGDILTGLGNLKVTNLSGLSFTIDEPEALQADAREEAIKDAREKAKKLAKDLGVRLGDVVSFSENSGGYAGRYYAESYALDSAAVGKGGATPPSPELPVGENSIQSFVTIVYKIR